LVSRIELLATPEVGLAAKTIDRAEPASVMPERYSQDKQPVF